MKTKIVISIIATCMLNMLTVFSQNNEKMTANFKTDTITVYGNCGMCKATIEGALKKKEGIQSKNWNPETHLLIVTYDPATITLDQIHQKVASVGYDTDKVKAPDDVYNNLHGCCKYRGKDNKHY